MTFPDRKTRIMTRRDFLKIVAGLGGATILGGWIPEDWYNPVHPPILPKTSGPTPEPTATPTPAAGIEKQPDGNFVIVTEKGESLIVPQIARV